MRPPRPGRSLIVVAALTIACGSGDHRTAAPPPAPPTLQPCQTPFGEPAECGAVTVFENRAARQGRTIDIHFTVVRATDGHARDAVFLFAGGPGEGSAGMTRMAFGSLRALHRTMDVVAVDQRGTGESHPLMCRALAAAEPAAVFGHVFDPAEIDRCRTALERDADLTQYTTDAAVADVEDVRAALGYERVSLYGVSYGTRMAQAYARRVPARVKAMVLDGVVPFDNAVPLTYAASAQQSIDRVFAACAAERACRSAHPRLRDDFQALLHRLDGGPVSASIQPPGSGAVRVSFSRGDFGYALRGLLYQVSVPDLAAQISRAAATGDLSEFAQAYWAREATLEPVIAQGLHFSVFCAEDVPFPADPEIASASAGTFLGRYLFDEYRRACAHWPRAPIQADARTPIAVNVPTLLVSGYFDPVTPPEFAERVARTLPVSRLLVSPEGSHGTMAGCPRAAAAYVLERGTLEGMPESCGA